MSQNTNPYEAPQVEETVAPETDVVFRVRPLFALAGGVLGLMATMIAFVVAGVALSVTDRSTSSLSTMLHTYELDAIATILGGIGVGILVDALLQRKLPWLMPGHWFLMLMVVSPIARYGTTLVETNTNLEISATLLGEWHFVQIAVYLVLVLLLLAPIALTTTESRRWNRLLWSMLVLSLVILLLYPIAFFNPPRALFLIDFSFDFLSQLGSFALGVTVFVLGALELVGNRPKAKRRDVFHWLGVFLTGPLSLFFTIQMNEFGFI